MGYQLWVSDVTGEKRSGTGFIDFKKIFTDIITAKIIYENLVSYAADSDAKETRDILIQRDFDSAGVVDSENNVIGYVMTSSLNEGLVSQHSQLIGREMVISDSTPLSEIFSVLKKHDFVYIYYIDKIVGILSKADLNKPPVRIYVFGVVSLFEMHLSYWVNHYFPNDSWKALLSKERIKKIEDVFAKRKSRGMNQNLNLQECLQFCDKKTFLIKSDEFVLSTGKSKKELKTTLEKIESIRNNIAHAQNSIIDDVSLDVLSDTLKFCESFLLRSDEAVIELAKPQ